MNVVWGMNAKMSSHTMKKTKKEETVPSSGQTLQEKWQPRQLKKGVDSSAPVSSP